MRWVIYVPAGKGYASRTRILLDEETRPLVFESMKEAEAEAARHPGAKIERVEEEEDA